MAPASRFTTSKFRNAQLHPSSRNDLIRGQLPFSASAASTSASSANSTFSSEIKTNTQWIVTLSPAGDISFRSQSRGNAVGTAKVGGGGGVGDWDLSKLSDGVVAVGGLDGKITTYRLPSNATGSLETLGTLKLDDPVSHILLHPTTPSILVASTVKGTSTVHRLPCGESLPLLQKGTKGLWDLSWSPCGRFVAGIGKDGVLSIWEPRQSSEPTVTKQMSLMQPLKPARVEWVNNTLFLSSFSRSRDRQYTLHATDPTRKLETLAQQTMDQNTSAIKTAVDQERGIIFAAGRGDMTLRQIELQEPSNFIETLHPLTSPLASSSLALAHPSTLPVMQAQIGTLLLPIGDKDGDAIHPTAIKVPRRQLIDYHEELFPDFRSDEPAQSAADWWGGNDAAPAMWTLDPARRYAWESKLTERTNASQLPVTAVSPASASKAAETSTAVVTPLAVGGVRSSALPVDDGRPSATPSSGPSVGMSANGNVEAGAVSEQRPTEAVTETPSAETAVQSSSAAPPAGGDSNVPQAAPKGAEAQPSPTASSERPKEQEKILPAPAATSTPALQHKTTSASASKSRFNPGWSRKFLGAKAALIPSYDQLPPLFSLHPDSILLQTSKNHLFFPIAGPGGRLAVHPRKAKGRMPVGGRGYLSGGVEMSGFAVDPFSDRVAVAGEDGAVRVWTVGAEGFEGVGPEADAVLKGKNVDRITQVTFHPTSRNLLVVATNDLGKAHLRFFDIAAQQEALVVPIEADGIFNFDCSIAGNKIAIATKDKRIMVLDPRDGSNVAAGKAHDSPRSSQLAWIDDTHLVSVGFSTGSQRKIQLYELIGTDIKTIETVTIDVSPSVLFPVFDADTSILYIWGRGERAIQAYQVDLADGVREKVVKLPAYTGPNAQLGVWFAPKTEVDVRKVEVGKCWRLTAKTIEEVTFSIPRNKPDFFQDDIYVPTLDTGNAAQSATDWLAGQNKTMRLVDLRPDGMTLLSEAPKPQASNKPKFVPGAKVMSEEERKRQEMEELFKKAKMDLSDSESEEERGVPAPDDDW